MKAKKSKQSPTLPSATQFEEAMSHYEAVCKREREIRELIEAEMNDILDRFNDELDSLAQRKKAAYETAQSYCTGNKDTLFGKRRSIATLHGMAGFRLGTPRLKTLQGETWENILLKLKEKLPAYIRIIEEPAKDLLLADRNKENVAAALPAIGIQVVQEELFYIETAKAA